MAVLALTNVFVVAGKYDISSESNALAIQFGADVFDVSTFGASGTHKRIAGLKSAELSLSGFPDLAVGLADDQAFNGMIGNQIPFTIDPTNFAAEGDVAYLVNADVAEYSPVLGNAAPAKFSIKAQSTSSLARGALLATRTTSGTATGTVVALDLLTARTKIVAAFHLLAITGGGTFTPKVQSDVVVGMGGAVDRVVFAGLTVPGSAFSVPIAAVADGYWRASWTLTGGAPTALFVVSVGAY